MPRVLTRARTTSAAAVLLVVSPLLATAVDVWDSDAAAPEAADAWERVVDLDFDSGRDASGVVTPGEGRWRIGSRGLELVWAPGKGTAHALVRQPVDAAKARVRLVVNPPERAPGSATKVVVTYAGPRDLSYVRLGGRPGQQGLYTVADGRTRRVADLSAPVASATRLVVDVRHARNRVDIRVGHPGGRESTLSAAAPPGPLRPGVGGRTKGLRLGSLVVKVPAGEHPPPTPGPTPGPVPGPTPGPAPGPAPQPVEPVIGLRNITVTTAAELTTALAQAQPGDAITMADGVYTTKGLAAPLIIGTKQYVGTFVASLNGTPEHPIVLQGSPGAVIDGKPGADGTGTQYGLYLAGADHWWVRGITVRNVSKGIVLDESDHARLEGLTVRETGQEGIHLRAFSSDNLVSGNLVTSTGLSNATYGEGLYVGSANSNWGTYSSGQPDASDRNRLIGNDITQTGAESIDIKEGTTAGLVQGNTFDGAGMTGSWADSWIDVKGNDWLIAGNHGTNALEDGFQVHGALTGWGNRNVFRNNTADVRGPGYGFWLQNNVTANVVDCANVVFNAAKGLANTTCTSS